MSDNKINCICVGFDDKAKVSARSNIDYNQIEVSKEMLDSLASAVASEIKAFYESEEGRNYYNKWIEQHPQYA